MAIGVVDRLEMIDIDDRDAIANLARFEILDRRAGGAAVGDAGQFIDQRLVARFFEIALQPVDPVG